MICPNCGADTNSKYCEYCGSKITIEKVSDYEEIAPTIPEDYNNTQYFKPEINQPKKKLTSMQVALIVCGTMLLLGLLCCLCCCHSTSFNINELEQRLEEMDVRNFDYIKYFKL